MCNVDTVQDANKLHSRAKQRWKGKKKGIQATTWPGAVPSWVGIQPDLIYSQEPQCWSAVRWETFKENQAEMVTVIQILPHEAGHKPEREAEL